MGLNWRQFELGVLRPTLDGEPEIAIKLVGETIWHESDQLRALGQYPRFPIGIVADDNVPFGPGLGIASIEEPTWDWMVDVADKLAASGASDICFIIPAYNYQDLAYDLRLNVLACRFRYKLDKRPLPVTDTIEARARYWLSVYNGSGVESRRAKYILDAMDLPWVK